MSTGGEVAAAHLLGREVGRGADDLVDAGQAFLFGQQRDAEIAEVGHPALVEQDVGRLDVAVHHAVPVHVRERVGQHDTSFRVSVSERGPESRRSNRLWPATSCITRNGLPSCSPTSKTDTRP